MPVRIKVCPHDNLGPCSSPVVTPFPWLWLRQLCNGYDVFARLLTLTQVVGEELSPGVKKGGYLNLIQRRVNCVGPASAIPKELELDVSSLDFGQRINMSGLNLPAEISIAGAVGHSCSIYDLPHP